MAIPAFGISIVQSDNRPTFIPDLKKYISLPIFNKMPKIHLKLKLTSSQTRKMRYPAVKLTDCGKTCTLTKLQTAEPEKFKVKFV